MNWHADDTWLDEYTDGTLSADEVRAADVHLAGCERCRAIVADFQAIRLLSRSLEPQRATALLLDEAGRVAAGTAEMAE